MSAASPDICITAAAAIYAAHASRDYREDVSAAEGVDAKQAVPVPPLWEDLDKPNQEFWLGISRHMAGYTNPEKRNRNTMSQAVHGKFGSQGQHIDARLSVDLYLNVRSGFLA